MSRSQKLREKFKFFKRNAKVKRLFNIIKIHNSLINIKIYANKNESQKCGKCFFGGNKYFLMFKYFGQQKH